MERAGPISARQRYGGLSMAGKKALLDEQVVITGEHGKSVQRALKRSPSPPVVMASPEHLIGTTAASISLK